MGSLTVWTKIDGQEKYKALARRLKDAGRGDLQRKLTRAVRKEGAPALAAVRAKWAGVDVTSTRGGGSSSGLRARVAAATRMQVLGTAIRIKVDSKKVDPRYGRQLTFGLDGLGRWRHPVFGNRKVWTEQKGQEVFYSTLTGYAPRWRAGIARAMEDVARQIEG